MFGRVGLIVCSTRWVGTLVVLGYFDYSGFIKVLVGFIGEFVMLILFTCQTCFSSFSDFLSSRGFISI